MKKNYARIIAAVVAVACILPLLCGCIVRGPRSHKLHGDVVSRSYDGMSGKCGILIENMSFTDAEKATANLIRSDKSRVEVTCSESLLKQGFDVRVIDGEIVIGCKSFKEFSGGEFTVNVYADFNSIDVKGCLNLNVDAAGASALELDISGATKSTVSNLDVSLLDVELDGAGEVTISGYAQRQEIDIDGAGKIDACGLVSDYCEVDVAGAGEVAVSVQKTLDVEISGVGKVEYYGSPEVIQKVNGVGGVNQMSQSIFEKAN